MLLPDAPDIGKLTPDPIPAPEPTPVVPPTPAPAPVVTPERLPSDELAEQWAGADKALLASSMAGGVTAAPDDAAKYVRLGDKLGLSADVVKADYENLTRRVALDGADLTRVSMHHPELASWLMVPENASVAHDDLPALKQVDASLKLLAGQPLGDVTGVLPVGYVFRKDGTIRGPLLDGQAVVYKDLDELQQHFARQAEAEGIRAGIYDQEHGGSLAANDFGLALKASVAGTVSALRSIGGPGREAQDIRYDAEQQLSEAAARDQSTGGAIARLAGQLTGDLPLYLAGGEVVAGGKAVLGAGRAAAAVDAADAEIATWRAVVGASFRGSNDLLAETAKTKLAQSLQTIAKAAEPLAANPRSTYLIDAFKNAAAFSPVAARQGINEGTEQGEGYGATSFLINAIGPAAAGRLGIAGAVKVGEETAAASGGWGAAAGRLLAHAGAQGGAMAVTELANALHEVATGVDPNALAPENLLPRLGQAGAMGGLLGGAFHLPEAIGTHVMRQQIAARAAIDHADLHAYAIESLQGSKLNERVPGRAQELLKRMTPEGAKTVYAQEDDFLAMAKAAGMKPDEFAAAMHVEKEWADAKALGKTMALPTAEMHQRMAALGDEKPEAVTAFAEHIRQHPQGMNGQEALDFHQAKPSEIDAQVKALRQDVAKAAKGVSEADPIYQDFLQQVRGADRTVDEAKSAARIMAAFFHTKAARWNAEADTAGTARMDPVAEYQKYRLRVRTSEQAATEGETADATTLEQRLEVPSAHLRHEYLLKQWKKAHGDRSPTPTDKDWQKLVHQADMVDEAQGRFFQPGSRGIRGSLEFDPARHFIITLTGKANLSTVAHESAHAFLEFTKDFAEREGAPQSFKDDYAKILHFLRGSPKERLSYEDARAEWATLSDDERVKRHELWARSIEQYLMEGQAPSPELRPVFQRYLIWLTDLYRKVQRLVNLTPEVRQVMDRMLATDEAIARAHEDLGYTGTFKDRESSGMSEAQWHAYQKDVQRQREQTQSNVFTAAMKTLRRQHTKTYRSELASAKEEAAQLINARPISQAEDRLVHGIDENGRDLPQKPKLDRAEIEALRPGATKDLPRGITATGDLGPYLWSLTRAAEEFGFSDREALLDALATMPNRKVAIAKLAEDMIHARNPELTPEAMHEKAMQAVHANSGMADVLGRESAALAIKAGRTAVPQAELKRIAEAEIAKTPMEAINPKLFLRAQKKSGDEATAELLKKDPDYTRAFQLKQAQELAHAMYRAAQEAEAVIDKTHELMKTVGRKKTQQMLGKAGGQGWSVVNPDGSVISHPDEASAVAAAKENGGTAQVGVGYLTAMNNMREEWSETKGSPYADVLDLYRQAVTTMHQANDALVLITEGKREELNKAVREGMRVENTLPGAQTKIPVASRGKWDFTKNGVGSILAFMRKLSFVTRQMDGERDNGWHWQQFTRRLNHASDHQQRLQHENATAMDAIYKAYGKTNFMDHRVKIDAIRGERMSLETRLAIALNSGSTKNLRRLASGHGYDAKKVQAVLDTLDEKDWQFVKSVWAHINSRWEETKALSQKLDGVPPEKRDSLLVATKFGTIQGAYYPIVYDLTKSARGIKFDLEKNAPSAKPKLSHSFTHATVAHTTFPLLLTLDGIHRHLNEQAHWLSHAEPIAEIHKLLSNEELSANMIEQFGKPAFDVLRDTISDVAKGTQGPQNIAERILRFLRTRSGMATMGFNTMSALSQPFGMTQSMERVGAAAYLRAQARFIANPMEASARVRAASTMMRHRMDALIVETAEQQGAGPARNLHDWMQNKAYWLMNRTQWMVDVPTWEAAYENALKDHPGDAKLCADLADQTVLDTQGSGLTKDLSKGQRIEYTKMLMQFAGFFNGTYNLLYNRAAADAHFNRQLGVPLPAPNDVESMGRLIGSFLLLVSLPAVGMSLFKQGMRPDPKDDNSAGWWAKRLAKDHAGYLLNTLIFGRELSGALDGFDYGGPAGMRSVALSSQLLKRLMHGANENAAHPRQAQLDSAVQVIGSFTGLPGTQAKRIIDAILYYHDHPHELHDPRPLLAGPPQSR